MPFSASTGPEPENPAGAGGHERVRDVRIVGIDAAAGPTLMAGRWLTARLAADPPASVTATIRRRGPGMRVGVLCTAAVSLIGAVPATSASAVAAANRWMVVPAANPAVGTALV